MKKTKSVIGKVLFSLIAVIYISPLLIVFTNSFMNQKEIYRNYNGTGDVFAWGRGFITMNLIPEMVTLSQYVELLLKTPVYINMFWNSVQIALPVVIGNLAVSAMAAYAFTVLRFKGKEVLFFIYIIVMLLPQQVTLMPNYVMAGWLHITDSYLGIILPGIFHPFGVFLLRQFMKMIPQAYIESAAMDGAGHLKVFTLIILPMVKSGLAACAMLTWIDYWNLIDQAVIFITKPEAQPLSLFLANLNREQIGVAFAGSCVYALPVVLLLFYGQEYLEEGISLSGVKG